MKKQQSPANLLFILLTLTLILISIPAAVLALGGDVIWQTTDSRADKQEAAAMVVDSAGNVIVAGYTVGSGNDYQLAKFKADGSGLSWTPVTFGGGGDDTATAVAVDSSDNIIVTGYTWNGSDYDIKTIKYNGADGSILWQDTFAGAAGGNDFATAIAVDGSNNIYVAGYSANASANDDYLILKYAPEGSTPVWQEIYDSSYHSHDRITAIAAGSDGIAVTGYSSKGGADFDILTRKYGFDKSLVREWRYSSAGSRDDRGVAVKIDPSGYVLVTGFQSNANNTDIYTVKYNPASDSPSWERIYSGPINDEPKALWVDGSGDLYLAGYTATYSGNEDFYTARYQGSDGAVVWESFVESGNGNSDIPVAIAVDGAADGGVFVAGYSVTAANEDFLTIKYRKDNGTVLWQKSWNSPANRNDRPVGIGLFSRNVLVGGWTDSLANSYDFQVLKYDYGPINPPTGLAAEAASNISITINWQDNSGNEDGFKIERKLGEGGTYSEITTVGPETTTYTDPGLTTNSYYYYRVRAYNAANGNSAYSNEARALTKIVTYDPPTGSYTYNGADNREDEAIAVTVNTDDHPVVTGYSDLSEEGVPGAYSYDYMTIKLNRSDMSVKWKAKYDSGDGGTDMAAGVGIDGNNDVIVTGTAYLMGASDKSDDLYTIKYSSASHNDPNSNPPMAWDFQYGTQAGIDQATAIQTAVDGSNKSVVIGYGRNASNNDDIFIIKFNADGTRPWTPIVYDSGRNDYPEAVALDSAGNIYVTGFSENASGNWDWFTAKYNGATGALIWSDNLDGGHGDDQAFGIAVDASGNAYVTGYTTNAAGNTDFYTIKYDGAASPPQRRIWDKSHDGAFHGDDEAVDIKIDPIDGAVVVAGTEAMSATDTDMHLIRYNAADGAVIWDENFDQAGYDYAVALGMDSSGYLYLAGNTRSGPETDPAFDATSNILSIIYDYEGTFLGALTYDATARRDQANAVTVNYQGEAFIAGFSTNAAGNRDYVVLKQKNNYILVPAPLTLESQADCTKMKLNWHDNSPGTSFRIERTLWPSSPSSVWTTVTTASPGGVTYTDAGLSSDTRYCWRIDAYSGSLNSRKIETCGTTTLQAPVLNALTVDSSTQITLSWNQVTDNTGYKVERKIGAGTWVDLTIKGAGENSHTDTGLTPGTTYYYRVSANSISGFSLASNEQNAPTKPEAPAHNAPTAISSTGATLNWTNVAGETGYKVERKEGVGGTWSEITTRGVDVVTFADTGLTNNTQYYYRIRAYNASGDSSYSAEQGVLTQFISSTLSSATAVSTTQVDLSWTEVPGATSYTLQEISCYRNNQTNDVTYCTSAYLSSSSYWPTGWTNIYSGTDLTYQRTARTSGYAYAYRVIAYSGSNPSAASNTIIAWTWMTAPTLTIAPASETSLTPSWTNINAATNYTLERKQGAGGTWAEVTGAIGMGLNAASYTDTGLSLSTEYCYRVKAYSTLPNNPPYIYSNEPCLYTPLAAPPLNAPTAATTTVDLTWSNVVSNTGYQVQRAILSSYLNYPQYGTTYLNNDAYWSAWADVATLPADTVSWQDTSATGGYTYRYRVRYSYSGGYSAWSGNQSVTTLTLAPALNVPTAASTTQLNLSWNNINGESTFNLEWKQRSGADCSAGAWGGPISIGQNATSYNHTELTAGTFYCYRLYGNNATGSGAYSVERSQTTLAVPPTLDALSGVTATQIVLTWNNIAGNTGYKIERKIGAGGSWSTIFTTAADAVTYTNTDLTAGALYYYRVSTKNAGGDSSPSNESSTTTTPAAPNVTATIVSAAEISLTWPVVLGGTNYKIERKEGEGAYSEIANVAVSYVEKYCGYDYPTVACPSLSAITTSYQSIGLTENTSYCHRIRAWNATGGDSPVSTERCVTTSAMAPQNLTATAVNPFRVRLDWTPIACTPNPCDNPDGFELQRLARDGNWVQIKTFNSSTTTYTDTIAIDPNRQYSYRVRSLKGGDYSPWSNTALISASVYQSGAGTCP